MKLGEAKGVTVMVLPQLGKETTDVEQKGSPFNNNRKPLSFLLNEQSKTTQEIMCHLSRQKSFHAQKHNSNLPQQELMYSLFSR